MSEMEKITGNSPEAKSLDITQQNIEQLKQLFPDVFSENKIDFEALKAVLGEEVDDSEERYNFTWNGKNKARQIAQTPSTGTLRPSKEESVNWDTTENLFIEGDNLEVLKLLQKSYHKKVKMIYIDPPYNTGNDFVYKDNFHNSIAHYFKLTGQTTSDGHKLSTNPDVSGRFHSDWLSMMYPRLKLSRNLLTDSGAIFISIGDKEVANLIKLCNEVFGEENHLATLIWEKKKKGAFLSGTHTNIKEYIVVYAKNISQCEGMIGEITSELETYPVIKTTNKRGVRTIRSGISSKYKKPDVHLPKGYRISAGNQEMILLSDLIIKDSILVNDVEVDSNWIYSQSSLDDYCDNRELYITQDLYFRRNVSSERRKRIKDLLPRVGTDDDSSPNYTFSLNLFSDGWGTNEDANDELHQLFEKQNVFQFTKPAKLMAKLLASFVNHDDIVMDFFAGSGTMGDAVNQFNSQAGIKVSYILVQLPEILNKDDKDQQVAFEFCEELNIPTNISSLTKERLKRSDLNNEGFKVYKLDETNIRPWDADFENLESVLREATETIKSDRSNEDVFYEILLKYGIELRVPVVTEVVNGKQVFLVGAGALIVCLDDGITNEVVEGIAKLKDKLDPETTQVVFKDAGFADSNVKTNAIQILKQAGIDDVRSI